jgi:hypothetical protein
MYSWIVLSFMYIVYDLDIVDIPHVVIFFLCPVDVLCMCSLCVVGIFQQLYLMWVSL